MILVLVFSLAACKSKDYDKAMELYLAGEYDVAGNMFEDLGDYENSILMLNKSRYSQAEKYFEKGSYQEAALLYEVLGDYEDSDEKKMESMYRQAEVLMEKGALEEVRDILSKLGDYRDSVRWLDNMGWYAFHSWLKENDGFSVEKYEDGYTVQLTAIEDHISVEYNYLKNYTTLQIRILLGMEHEKVTVSAASELQIPNDYGIATVNDEASGVWNITGYKSGDKFEWTSYTCPGMFLQGQRVSSPFPINGNAKNIDSKLADITASIAQVLETSGLNITMADLGFASFVS